MNSDNTNEVQNKTFLYCIHFTVIMSWNYTIENTKKTEEKEVHKLMQNLEDAVQITGTYTGMLVQKPSRTLQIAPNGAEFFHIALKDTEIGKTARITEVTTGPYGGVRLTIGDSKVDYHIFYKRRT